MPLLFWWKYSRLASHLFVTTKAQFPSVERLTVVYAATVPRRDPNAFCHNNRKKGHISLQFPSGQQTHCCSDSSSFRQSQRSLGILTLGENQLIIQNPPSQQGTGNPGAYMHKTISQWNLPIMQKQPHSYVAMGFCSIRRADTEMERVIAHVNVL